MAGQVLGEAVNDDRGPVFQRPVDKRRREGVVDDERDILRFRESSDVVESGNAQEGVGDGFHQDRARAVLFNGGGDCAGVVEIDKVNFHTGRLEGLHHHVQGGSVEQFGGDYYAVTVEESRIDGHVQRGHAGTAGERTSATFQCGAEFFESVVGGVRITSVALARHLFAEDAVQVGKVVIEITGCRVDRGRDRDPTAV